MNDGLQMAPELMLDLARQAAELVVERIESLPGGDAWDGDFRQELENRLMEDPPEDGRPAAEVLERTARDILPVAARLDHPRFFGFIPSSPTWPGVLADFMAAGYNINAATWLLASGPSQLELVVIDWFRRWLGYPESAGGLLTSGGSAASVDALVAAREAAGHPERATVYMSDQSHSAHIRAARIIGVRPECIRMVSSDGRFRLDMDALARAVTDDRAAGFNPIAVCANAGATSTGAIDPLEAMADYCEAEGVWLHVDAAYGGFAVVTEEGKRLLRGMERADSIGLDAHKWFFQPYEAGGLLVKDASTLEKRVHGSPRCPPGHDMGREPPEHLGPRPATEPFVSGLEGLDVGADLRDGRVPAGRVEGDGAGRPGRGVRPGEPDPGDVDPRVAERRVLPGQSGGGRPRRGSPGEDQQECACPRLLGGPRFHVIDASQGDVFAQALHHSTTPRPGTTCARPWRPSSGSGGRRLSKGGPCSGGGSARFPARSRLAESGQEFVS